MIKSNLLRRLLRVMLQTRSTLLWTENQNHQKRYLIIEIGMDGRGGKQRRGIRMEKHLITCNYNHLSSVLEWKKKATFHGRLNHIHSVFFVVKEWILFHQAMSKQRNGESRSFPRERELLIGGSADWHVAHPTPYTHSAPRALRVTLDKLRREFHSIFILLYFFLFRIFIWAVVEWFGGRMRQSTTCREPANKRAKYLCVWRVENIFLLWHNFASSHNEA